MLPQLAQAPRGNAEHCDGDSIDQCTGIVRSPNPRRPAVKRNHPGMSRGWLALRGRVSEPRRTGRGPSPGPRRDEVVDELLLGVVGGVHLGNGPQLGVGSEYQVHPACRPLLPVARSVPTKVPSSAEDGAHWVPMSSRLVKKSFVSRPGVSVKTPWAESLKLAPSTRRPPIRTVISGADSVSRLARSSSWNSAGSCAALPR